MYMFTIVLALFFYNLLWKTTCLERDRFCCVEGAVSHDRYWILSCKNYECTLVDLSMVTQVAKTCGNAYN